MQRDNINFSIIIPHYNIPTLLKRCLDSIPRRSDIQIIVVDDNSSTDIVDFDRFPGLNDEYVEVVFTKEGKGAGYARNRGLEIALGKWLIFADSDDFFTQDLAGIFDEFGDINDDLVYFNVGSVFSEDTTKVADRNISKQQLFKVYDRDAVNGEILFRLKYPEPWGKMIRRELVVINKIRFDETRVANDYFFSTQIGCVAKSVKVVNRIFYYVTLRSGSLSYKFGDTLDKVLIRLDVTIRVQCYMRQFGYSLNPMPIRGLMVLLLKMDLIMFIRKLWEIRSVGIPVSKLLFQMLYSKYSGK